MGDRIFWAMTGVVWFSDLVQPGHFTLGFLSAPLFAFSVVMACSTIYDKRAPARA